MSVFQEIRLRDLYNELVMGQSPDSSSYNDEKIGLPFVQGNADMEDGFPKIRIYTSEPKKISEKGDILLSVRAPVGDLFKNNIGQIAIGRGISAIRINNSFLNEYVHQFFSWNKTQFIKLEQGTTFTEIGKREVRNLRIPLPENVVEIEHISTILAKVDSAVKSIESSIKVSEKLKRSLMQNLLTGRLKPDGTWRNENEFYKDEKFGNVPFGWQYLKLKDLCQGPGEYGANASATDFLADCPRYIRITDIDDYGNLIEDGKVGIEPEKVKNNILKENDFLFARTGDTVGKSLLYKESMGLAAYAGYLIKFSFKPNLVYPEYFNLLAKSDYFEAFKTAMKRVGAKPNINSREYGTFKFIIPLNTEDQISIYEKIRPIDLSVIQKQEKIKTLQRLKKSLMQNLLTGKVRVDVNKIEKLLQEQ